MNIRVKRWTRPELPPSPIEEQVATFETQREFEKLFDNPLVAERIVEIFRTGFDDQYAIMRISDQLAREYGMSTWNGHAAVKLDDEGHTRDSLLVEEYYSERRGLPVPGAGKRGTLDELIPKDKVGLYEGSVPDESKCWSCGGDLFSDRKGRIRISSQRHFANDEVIPDSYPHPARVEYLCDECTFGIVTTRDVSRYGSECLVCGRLKATTVERALVPEDTPREEVRDDSDFESFTTGMCCASCSERESIDYLEKVFLSR